MRPEDDRRLKIRNYLARALRRQPPDDQDLFASGLATSLFAMQLVLFLEKEFAISLGNDDLRLDYLRSVDAMCALVERKTTGEAAAHDVGEPV